VADNNASSTSVAKVTEISARSTTSFEDAMQAGIARATSTLRGVTSAWVKEQRVEIRDNRVVSYQVNMLITFTLED
jgi:flavin-binding protein dodecin